MNILIAFGVLFFTASVLALAYSFIEKIYESNLIKNGAIPPFTGYDIEQIRDLKNKGYKSIALKRIRNNPKKTSLKEAVKIYQSL